MVAGLRGGGGLLGGGGDLGGDRLGGRLGDNRLTIEDGLREKTSCVFVHFWYLYHFHFFFLLCRYLF